MDNLSIIIQGSFGTKFFPECQVLTGLKRMRLFFPMAEIIFSTWSDGEANDLVRKSKLQKMNVILVINDDPGQIVVESNGIKYANNVNRLIVSSSSGLERATRPYAIKMRSDCFLSDDKIKYILRQFIMSGAILRRNEAYSVFSSRLICSSLVARDARGSLPYLFHPSDFFLAGHIDDLRLFFSAPLATLSIFNPSFSPGLWSAWKYVPEQWLWVNAIRMKKGIQVYDGNFKSSQLIYLSEQYFLANFISFDTRQLSLCWPKYYKKYIFRGLFSLYSHSRWIGLYRRHHSMIESRTGECLLTLLIKIWRTGYCLRACLLKISVVRVFLRRHFLR